MERPLKDRTCTRLCMRKDTVTTLSIALFFVACIDQAVANIYVTICTTNVATVSKRTWRMYR